MTRAHLERYIAAHGITTASVKLDRHPISLERMAGGINAVPASLPDLLVDPRFVWRAAYTPEQIERIESMANSKGVELDERTAEELWEIARSCRDL
jgi:hypothetical protein